MLQLVELEPIVCCVEPGLQMLAEPCIQEGDGRLFGCAEKPRAQPDTGDIPDLQAAADDSVEVAEVGDDAKGV